MRPAVLLVPGALLLLAACDREAPQRVDNPNLGIRATFPGEARLNKHVDDTPFGRVEWFDTAYYPPGRMDESFHVEVGNLPPGRQGGTTSQAVADTFQQDLERRLGKLKVTDLPAEKGPGFRYAAPGPEGTAIEGVLVVRRGRLHHAQVTARKPGDPRIAAFLDSFEVAK